MYFYLKLEHNIYYNSTNVSDAIIYAYNYM